MDTFEVAALVDVFGVCVCLCASIYTCVYVCTRLERGVGSDGGCISGRLGKPIKEVSHQI
jgi:hypothetical protein